ncbi:MAG: DUF6155 family protein [Porphyromonadaceae bacterium]|nr:DUF6155 family protein [Porphyromonadaceae bacterium]
MSKAKLKSVLLGMEKKQIIEVMLELYNASKEAKGYLDFFAEPNEKEKIKEYKAIIEKEFYPGGKKEPQLRFSVCRKAISDFRKLKPSAESMADLMLFYIENACRFTHEYGDMWEQYYTSVEGNFARTLEFIVEHDLLEQFHPRIKQCLSWVDGCGWGFSDTLGDTYGEIVGPQK